MKKIVNIYNAKTHLSQLVERAAQGEEIVIAKAGRPQAMLVPLPMEHETRKPGCLKGRFQVADDFDAPLPSEMLDAFDGNAS